MIIEIYNQALRNLKNQGGAVRKYFGADKN